MRWFRALPFFQRRKRGEDVLPYPLVNKIQEERAEEVRIEVGYRSLSDKIAPSYVEIEKDYIRLDNKYMRTIYVVDYPPSVDVGFLSPVLGLSTNIDLSFHLRPLNTEEVIKKLTHQLAYYRAQLASEWSEGKVEDVEVLLSNQDAERLRLELQRGNEKLFQLGFYLTISAKSLEELDKLTHEVETLLGALSLKSRVAYYQSLEGYDTTLPLCRDELGVRRNISTSSLATFFPFDQSVLSMDSGVLLGINLQSNTLVILDPFAKGLENANGVVIAKSGSGKSYFAKLLCLRSLYQGARVIIIDPEREYDRLCKASGGTYVKFTPQGETDYLNPFDLPDDFWEGTPQERLVKFNDRIMNLRGFFKILLGKEGEEPIYNSLIEEALFLTYARKGLTREVFSSPNPPMDLVKSFRSPLLEDYWEVVLELAKSSAHKEEYSKLASILKPYVRGSLSELFSHPTTVDLDNRVVIFDIKDWEKDDIIRSLYMYLIFGYVWDNIRQKRIKTLFAIDEAWLILQYPDAAQFVRSVAKRARKYYCGLWVLVQDVEDLMSSDQWRAILTNSSIQVLLKQSPTIIDYLADIFKLSQQEQWFLLNCHVGNGLVFFGGDHVPIRVLASPEEHLFITSHPAEIQEMLEREELFSLGFGVEGQGEDFLPPLEEKREEEEKEEEEGDSLSLLSILDKLPSSGEEM